MRRFNTWILIIALLLSGCAVKHQNESSAEETEIQIQSSESIETIISSEPAASIMETETTEPESTEPEITEPEPVPLDTEPGSYQHSFTDPATGDYLDYWAFIPENAYEGMPLIVFLHGDGEAGKIDVLEDFGLISQARAIYGNEFPFISISPCTRVYSWIDGDIPTTLKALIDTVVQEYGIDTEHIIITGHSRGAIGVWYMVSLYGDYFSAAVPVSCSAQGYISFENCAHVPISAYVGDVGSNEARYTDEIANLIPIIQKYGGFVTLTVINGAAHGQTSTAAYTEETFIWMLEQ